MPRARVLVSACLLGERVRYNGADAASASAVLARWLAEGRVVPFCPEVAGGLGVPREPAEIEIEINGSGGRAVLEGRARVLTVSGADVTPAFLAGANGALARAREEGIRVAVLKEGSPSCGSGFIYDGSFSGRRVGEVGVTAALLEREGLRVFSELQLEAADAWLRELESPTA
ncbi:MAG TPA: DUF523 domain-containing protein [Vicinamibacteria bacterium]